MNLNLNGFVAHGFFCKISVAAVHVIVHVHVYVSVNVHFHVLSVPLSVAASVLMY
jgi:hypothetical protein